MACTKLDEAEVQLRGRACFEIKRMLREALELRQNRQQEGIDLQI
jgi:hypothetical protein